MRASGMTLDDIASWLGVSKSSVSLWVRDVSFVPSKRRYGPRVRPNALMRRKQEEIEWGLEEGQRRVGDVSERDLFVTGVALYAGEGSKTDGVVKFTNSDPLMVALFCRWFRTFFVVDESRLRVRVYLHEGLDLAAATAFWAGVTGIPSSQHTKAYRAEPDPSIRKAKHPQGCVTVVYASARTHREVMGMVRALLICSLPSGVAQSAAQATVNRKVLGSSPSPGAKLESLPPRGGSSVG